MSEFDTVIAAQAGEPNSGLIVTADAFTVAYRVEITSLAARYRLPAIYPFRLFAEVGGLLSYGVDLTDNFRRAIERPGWITLPGQNQVIERTIAKMALSEIRRGFLLFDGDALVGVAIPPSKTIGADTIRNS